MLAKGVIQLAKGAIFGVYAAVACNFLARGLAAREVAKIWKAARAGDDITVRTVLHRDRRLAWRPHPETGSTLLHEVAAVRTLDAAEDAALAEVMRVLICYGARVDAQIPPMNDTPMHVLMMQPQTACIRGRLLCLLRVIHAGNYHLCDVLSLRNAQNLGPEDVAAPAAAVLEQLAKHQFVFLSARLRM